MLKPNDATPLQTEMSVFLALEAALRAGVAEKHCVFEISADRLPEGWRYGILAGVGRALAELQKFRFDDRTLSFLYAYLAEDTIQYLEKVSFDGTLSGLPEGEFFLANTPVFTIECTYGMGILLEGFLLSILNHDSAVATAAFQLRQQIPTKRLYITQPQQVQEEAAVAFMRSAYVAGFDALTSAAALKELKLDNLYLGFRDDFHLLFPTQADAWRAQAKQLGAQTTIRLDGSERESLEEQLTQALEIFGPELFAVRIPQVKSLVRFSKAVRKLLNAQGAYSTNIIYDGGLADQDLADLASKSEIDSIALAPEELMRNQARSVGFELHLVAIQDETYGDFRPVSTDTHVGGKKVLYREYGADWTMSREILVTETRHQKSQEWIRPGVIYVQKGKLITMAALDVVRDKVSETRTLVPSGATETIYVPDPTADKVDDDEVGPEDA
jgi:nicotinate phosphoribosyltransferase